MRSSNRRAQMGPWALVPAPPIDQRGHMRQHVDSELRTVEVFADIACPFTHVGIARITAMRAELGLHEPVLRLRAWPLELVNGVPLDGPSLVPKVVALRRQVAPELFASFDPARMPVTTLPALASEVAAYRQGLRAGERFAQAVRHALFEDGLDVSDHAVLHHIRTTGGVPTPTPDDHAAVLRDHEEGIRRKVVGSPHFFTTAEDFFCPSLHIQHDEEGYDISFDIAGFERFAAAAFGPPAIGT